MNSLVNLLIRLGLLGLGLLFDLIEQLLKLMGYLLLAAKLPQGVLHLSRQLFQLGTLLPHLPLLLPLLPTSHLPREVLLAPHLALLPLLSLLLAPHLCLLVLLLWLLTIHLPLLVHLLTPRLCLLIHLLPIHLRLSLASPCLAKLAIAL